MQIAENKSFRKWIYLIPIIFIFELILGFSGKTIIIAHIPIRYILFMLSFICLISYMIIYMIENKVKFLSIKNFKQTYIGQFGILDWAVLVFLISSIISATIIPMTFGGNLRYALDDAKSIVFILMYFPVSFLIKKGKLDFEKAKKYIYTACAILSGIYVVFYIGLKQNIKFLDYFFEALNKVFFNLGEVPRIILGHNQTPRVIFTTCTFLIIGIYLFLVKEKKNILDYCILFINITALMATLTKSIWFGVISGVVLVCIYLLIYYIIKNQFKNIFRLGCTLACVIMFSLVMNFTLFDNAVLSRMAVSFATSQNNPGSGDNSGSDVIVDNDLAAATISNDVKIEQTQKLMNKWKSSPILGYGYGSYVEDCIRSETYPYSYEMQLPALLMKTGVIGMLAWGFLGLAMLITIFRSTKGNRKQMFCWLYLVIAFAMAVQTNPMLLSFTGMGIVTFSVLESNKN